MLDGLETNEILYFLSLSMTMSGSKPERWLHTNTNRPASGSLSMPDICVRIQLDPVMRPATPMQLARQRAFCLLMGFDVLTNRDTTARPITYRRLSTAKHRAKIKSPFHMTAPAARTYMNDTVTATTRKAMISIS